MAPIYLAAIGLAAGIVFWLVLAAMRRFGKPDVGCLLPAIFIIGLACRLAYVFGTPVFYAPDEQSHYNYIRYLYENRSLPIQTSQTGALSNDWEYYQPPLYYLAEVPIFAVSTALSEDVRSVVRMLRLFSVVLWVATAWLALRFLRAMSIADEFLTVTVFAMVCLLPSYTFISSMINNDNLVVVIGAFFLCSIAKEQFTDQIGIINGVLLGLAVLTKLTGVVYYMAFALVMSIEIIISPARRKVALRHMAVATAVLIILVLPWLIRNLSLYGSITGESAANLRIELPSIVYGIGRTLKYMIVSFWSVSGIHNNIRSVFPAIGVLVSALAALGLGYTAISSKRREAAVPERGERQFLLAMLLVILANVALVFRFGLLYDQGQGRFLYPLLFPIALLTAIGLRSYRLRNSDVWIAGLLATYSLSFTFFSLGMFQRLN